MVTPLKELYEWMRSVEDEHVEFKKAAAHFDSEKLTQYCVALANEGGGRLILGVSDKIPRKIVGTQAISNVGKTQSKLLDRLHLRVDIEEMETDEGRVVIVHVPSRPIGHPVEYKGAYWMRSGESLVPMTPEKLKNIFSEAELDFSAQICEGARLSDLDTEAIEIFRQKWHKRTNKDEILQLSDTQILEDAELTVDGAITYAALILFGTAKALGRHLAQAEIVFEYRSQETVLPAQQREEFRKGFFLYYESLWDTINLRNDNYQYQDGLFMFTIPSFHETVIREAILNAVSHRDYRLANSVFIRQDPSKIEFISPGGFPPGITIENILWKQYPRNRRISEAFARCGLVERSGQGVNRMFEQCARESKDPPDFSGTDAYQVFLTLKGKVQDPNFLKFLEKIAKEKQISFDSTDFIILDMVNREQKIPEWARERTSALAKAGALERVGRKYILSKKYYEFTNKKGVYTRKRGLDRETNKQLLLKHIKDNRKTGSRLKELRDVLPTLSKDQVQTLLREMKQDDLIICEGRTNAARWYPADNQHQ